MTTGTTTVWAHFNDGRLLIIPNNRDTSDPGDTLGIGNEMRAMAIAPAEPAKRITLPRGRAAMCALAHSTAGPGLELPASTQYHAWNAIGTCHVNPLPKIKAMLNAHGYVDATVGKATVANLKNVRNDGVFYINTHGGIGKAPDSTEIYGVWTEESGTPALEAQYKAMLDAYEVVYMEEKSNRPDGTCGFVSHYGITAGFVNQYMRFSPNSLVFVDACESFADPNLRQAFANDNASVYLGWSGLVQPRFAYTAAHFLFDRLLGANMVDPKETPPQRAFKIDDVLADMAGRSPSLIQDPVFKSVLMMERKEGDFSLLAPSILFASFGEGGDTEALYIAGTFGSDPGPARRFVWVNEQALNVVTWGKDLIVAQIPTSGATSFGTLQVAALSDGTGMPALQPRESNEVNITDWRGKFTYTRDDPDAATANITMNVHFRADIHAFREKPHETPWETIVLFEDDKDASATASAGGSFTEYQGECATTFTYAGSLNLGSPWYPPAGGEGEWKYYGQIDTKTFQFLINLSAIASLEGGSLVASGPQPPCMAYTVPIGTMVEIDDCLYDDRNVTNSFKMAMNSHFDVLHDYRSCEVNSLVYPLSFATGTAKIEWEDLVAQSPPDSAAAR